MAILKNCEMHWIKCDPKNPDRTFEKTGMWTVQLRTTDPEQRKEWADNGLKPKLQIHREGDEEGMPMLTPEGKKQWRVNLQKRCFKRNGEAAEPVKIVNGKLEDLDSRTVGNGSIGNIRVYQYDSTTKEGEKVSILMAIQVTKHVVYEPRGDAESFDFEETEVVAPQKKEAAFEDDVPFEQGSQPSKTSKAPAKPSAKPPVKTPSAPKTADDHPEDAF